MVKSGETKTVNYETYLDQLRQSSRQNYATALQKDTADSHSNNLAMEHELQSHSATKGLFAHIQSNNIKSLAVFAVFLFLIQVIQFAFMIMFVPVQQGKYVNAPLIQNELIKPSSRFKKFGEGDISSKQIQNRSNLSTFEVIRSDLEIIWDALVTKSKIYEGWSLLIFIPSILYIISGLWFARTFVKRQTGAHRIKQHQEPRLYALVENLTLSRGLPLPAIEIIETKGRNAYASGFHPRNSAIGVTRGLLEALNDAELEAVLAHEVAHIEGRDNRLMTFSKLCVGAVSSAGRNISDALFANPIRLGLISIFIIALAPLTQLILFLSLIFSAWGVAELINGLISQKREFIADARAIEIMKSPAALISALQKVSVNDYIEGINPDVQAMMISNLSGSDTKTHPSIEARIKAIEETTSVNYADIQSIRLLPNRLEWGGQSFAAEMPSDTQKTEFGKKKQVGTISQNENHAILEDQKLQSTYYFLMALDRGVVRFTNFLIKICAFSPLAGLFLVPIFLLVAIISSITGLSWPLALGVLVIAIFWWRRRNK